jgi:predicted pyridoxine 5'-phosphate oxidase superfamily flavin-nucleotide-binding protein
VADFFEALTAEHREFIERQPVFFVATAPADGGRVNLSPKGMDTLRVVDERTVAYLDLTGSGNETAAHIADDGRVTLMLCSFDRTPLILRLYGTGRVLSVEEAARELDASFPDLPGARQVIVCDVDSVQTSCGYAVPVMDLVDERRTLTGWAASKGADELAAYRDEKNRESIDGLPITLPG